MAQTLKEIRETLTRAGLHPNKRFGQHFLIDSNLLAAIVDLSGVGPEDGVLEIGPGTGTLTDELLAAGATIVAVEIDRGMAALLVDRYTENRHIRLLHCDVMAGKHAINPEVLAAAELLPRPIHLVSNLPYNIATPLVCECLLRSLAAEGEGPGGVRFADLTVTVQKEVAQRLAAKVGGPLYGAASVLVALLSRIQLGKRIPASAFWPRPKVASQMVRIEVLRPPRVSPDHADTLVSLLRWAFGQRRKKIGSASRMRNAPFAAKHLAAALDGAGIDPNVRPDRITHEQYACLASLLAP